MDDLFRHTVSFRIITDIVRMSSVNYSHGIAKPFPGTLNPGYDRQVFIPACLGSNRPQYLGLVINIDVIITLACIYGLFELGLQVELYRGLLFMG